MLAHQEQARNGQARNGQARNGQAQKEQARNGQALNERKSQFTLQVLPQTSQTLQSIGYLVKQNVHHVNHLFLILARLKRNVCLMC